ncbi:biotin/lipoyl-binding protein [Breoghania sp.]|uniref:biotin/lipoyl-binding protein n=1 Tax=Breoghania sp. TaxID=2065378 RepID=UPI0026347CD4|nr:biotin/lipoyl-binding protein [Breoghania sp.]MDJ0933435.1 biotin/lipoyl-binding protein [Breoghania sp.]
MSKVDIVVSAQGHVVPIGGTKLVQAQEISTVRSIHVADGQHVQAGDVLVELDSTDSAADIEQFKLQRDEAAITAARLEAYIKAVQGKLFILPSKIGDLDPSLVAMHQSRLASDLASFKAQLGAFKAEHARQKASVARIRAEVEKLEELRPLVVSREANILHLMEQGYTPTSVWQQVKAQLIDVTHDRSIKAHQIEEAESQMLSVERKMEGLLADTLQLSYVRLVEAR